MSRIVNLHPGQRTRIERERRSLCQAAMDKHQSFRRIQQGMLG
jgi:hypothetical protein